MPDGHQDRAIAAALAAAGIESPEDKLLRIVTEALERHPTNSALVRGHVLGAARHDITLLWTLTKDLHGAAIEQWTRRAREARRNKISEGQVVCETHRNPALPEAGTGSPSPSNPSVGGHYLDATQEAAATNIAGGASSATGKNCGGHERDETQTKLALAKVGIGSASPGRPFITAGQFRAQHGVAARYKVIRTICRLDTVLVNGKPVGDCTVGECWDFVKARQEQGRAALIDVRFVSNLCANLPSSTIVRDQWKDQQQVDDLYDRARKFAEATLPC